MSNSSDHKTMHIIYAILMILSLNPYFIWHIDFRIMWLFYFCITLFLIFKYQGAYHKSSSISYLVMFAVAFYSAKRGNAMAFFAPSLAVLPFFAFLFLDKKEQIMVFNRFKKIFSYVLAISLAAWVLLLIHIPLPSIPDFYGDPQNEASYYIVNNYFLVIQNYDALVDESVRFQSIFLEPGYIGCLSVFLLYLDDINLKKRDNKIFLATVLFSLSLAAWVLLAITLFVYMVKRRKMGTVVVVSVFLVGICYGSLNYNGGNNIVKELIIDRLEYDEDSGKIAGYNRTTDYFDDLFDRFIVSSDAMLGDYDGFNKLIKNGSHLVGWKAYTMKFGLWGLCTYVIYLLFVLSKSRKRVADVSWFAVHLLFFIRGDTLTYNLSFLIVYLAGYVLLDEEYEKASFLKISNNTKL